LDHQLRAFRTVFVDAAQAEAEVADQRLATGDRLPLLGIPIAVKDDIDVAGAATMWGTSVDNGPVAEDCEVVRRLRRAGAIIIGKTAMPELAMWSLTESSSWGIARNPWNADLSPGGSSGGSAAAVAAGLVPAAIGSDGGGSIRMPAAACGLFGMKAQRGRVSVMPSPERWYGLLQLGPLTRSVADSALIYDVISGNVAGDATSPPPLPRSFTSAALPDARPARIAVSYATPLPTRVHEEARRPVETTARLLAELGHEVVAIDPPYGLGAVAAFPRFSRGTSDLGSQLGQTSELERRTRLAAHAGRLIPDAVLRLSKAAERRRYVPRVNRFFESYDFVLTPAMSRGALEAGEWRDRGLLRSLAAMTALRQLRPRVELHRTACGMRARRA
jgi:amidase